MVLNRIKTFIRSISDTGIATTLILDGITFEICDQICLKSYESGFLDEQCYSDSY